MTKEEIFYSIHMTPLVAAQQWQTLQEKYDTLLLQIQQEKEEKLIKYQSEALAAMHEKSASHTPPVE